ncbi:SGNH/GDSL hydrolase family protein [Streptomyces tropicalis]|uniref:SGNH/GDSL hydrolase family protein n=1 Tax=Streptomyces tropicalis TaxID=3034234 RepID=A0ABT6A427_9ACTN|nr:SGNH/GDSL hydrolase family protein [Streptomyces tropicalis]MDF3298565.1 SGNH/GDSL hydrolase family protein [Streptomyces tropicalis]
MWHGHLAGAARPGPGTAGRPAAVARPEVPDRPGTGIEEAEAGFMVRRVTTARVLAALLLLACGTVVGRAGARAVAGASATTRSGVRITGVGPRATAARLRGAAAWSRGTGAAEAPAAVPLTARSGIWTGTWEAAPSGTARALPGASIRNVVHISVGGRALRIRLSNRLGGAPLRLGAVTVALAAHRGPAAVPGSMRRAVFHGAPAVTVPAGRDVVSDPVPLAVPAAADLLVTVYTPVDSGPATHHRSALRTGWLAHAGDRSADENGAAYTATTGFWYYVTGVDVLAARAAGSVVALGDSLTDGTGSTPGADHRWPDRLAGLLAALPPARRFGVLNAGISGNRLLRDGVGPSALDRLDPDALSRAGVRVLVVWEGVNDLKGSPAVTDPAAFVTAYRTIAVRAHARGIRVVGATLTPYRGYRAWTAAGEAVREQVNALIRGGGVFDAVVDLDAVVRDPGRPDRILPAYDPGDHLHLDDAGMLAVASAVRTVAFR